MAANTGKPAVTLNPQVSAIEVARAWLAKEGGRQQMSVVIDALLAATATALARGEPVPFKDSGTLTEIWKQEREGDGTAGSPVRGIEVQRWWEGRTSHLRQACLAAGCEWIPRLVVQKGGGRGLSSRLGVELHPLDAEGVDSTDGPDSDPGVIRYEISPAKPAWWIRWTVGDKSFRMNSWRGYVLVGSVVFNFLIAGSLIALVYWLWSFPRPLTTQTLATLASTTLIVWGIWTMTRPLRLLPTRRVTLAGVTFLSMSELYGQLRALPDPERRHRYFSVVRHWGRCPRCAAEVDLDEGGKQFPDRLVGRCHDAPYEHVYSFDPVKLEGRELIR